MSFAADLHLHLPYAMGVSRAMSLEALAWWAEAKGLDALACGDFTHPAWLAELRRKLRPDGDGLFALREDEASPLPEQLPFALRGEKSSARFVLGTEISCVYPQGGRTRRIHILILAPDFAAVDGLRKALAPFGALESDGRPTLRLSARDLVEAALTVSPLCEAIPAHVWTPWYGALGAKGGFDSLAEALGDMAPRVRAVETGLSTDPAMNWRAPDMEGRTLVSFSDAHSAPRLGREFTIFSGEPSYAALIDGLRNGRVEWTGEFHPQEGKYYYDGHRKCGVRVAPENAGDGRCPACGRPMTRGALGRIAALSGRPPSPPQANAAGAPRGADGTLRDADGTPRDADGALRDADGTLRDADGTLRDADGTLRDADGTLRDANGALANADGTLRDANGTLRDASGKRPAFRRLVPLQEIIAEALGRGAASKAAQEAYFRVIERVGPELRVLVDADEAEIAAAAGERIAEGVIRARTGRTSIEPGFDGQYGTVRIWGD